MNVKRKSKKISRKKKTLSKKIGARHISAIIKERPEIKKVEKKIEGKVKVKHLVVYNEIVANRGQGKKSKSIGEAMKNAGYSEAYQSNPHQLTSTKSWKKLMEEHLSDKTLSEHHAELLNAKEIAKFDFPVSFTDEEILEIIEGYGFKLVQIITNNTGMPEFRSRKAYFIAPNTRAKKDAIDMAYKLKGLYEPDKHTHKFDGLTKEELISIVLRGVEGKGGSGG